MRIKSIIRNILLISLPLWVGAGRGHAQVGEQRSRLSIGGNGGYVLSNVGFVPKVTQGYHGGMTFGFSARYTSEKYFNTLCALGAEVNYAQLGWKENILDFDDKPVIVQATGEEMKYQRTVNYIQVPIYAHLSWGKETKGFSGFVNLGPQFGVYLDDSYEANFDIHNKWEYNMDDRASLTIAQDTMAIENTFDYGIMAGAGLEYSHPKLGHFLLEARYYYGLGNMYGDSKRDYFGRSNFGNIVIKAAYLFDLFK